MNASEFPLLNGVRPSFTSLYFNVRGTNTPVTAPLIGFTSFDYSDELINEYAATASFTMYAQDFAALVNAIGAGYMRRKFDFCLCFRLGAEGLINLDELQGCRIKSVRNLNSNGDEALQVKVDLAVDLIRWGCVHPTDLSA